MDFSSKKSIRLRDALHSQGFPHWLLVFSSGIQHISKFPKGQDLLAINSTRTRIRTLNRNLDRRQTGTNISFAVVSILPFFCRMLLGNSSPKDYLSPPPKKLHWLKYSISPRNFTNKATTVSIRAFQCVFRIRISGRLNPFEEPAGKRCVKWRWRGV